MSKKLGSLWQNCEGGCLFSLLLPLHSLLLLSFYFSPLCSPRAHKYLLNKCMFKTATMGLPLLSHSPSSARTHLAFSFEDRACQQVDRESFQHYFSGFTQWQVGRNEREGLSPPLGLHQPISSLSTLWEAPQTPACRSELTWSIPAAPRYISRSWEM